MEQAKQLAASWARSFLAAALATYLAVGWEPAVVVNAGVAAVLPVILRWLNPNDSAFGRR